MDWSCPFSLIPGLIARQSNCPLVLNLAYVRSAARIVNFYWTLQPGSPVSTARPQSPVYLVGIS